VETRFFCGNNIRELSNDPQNMILLGIKTACRSSPEPLYAGGSAKRAWNASKRCETAPHSVSAVANAVRYSDDDHKILTSAVQAPVWKMKKICGYEAKCKDCLQAFVPSETRQTVTRPSTFYSENRGRQVYCGISEKTERGHLKTTR